MKDERLKPDERLKQAWELAEPDPAAKRRMRARLEQAVSDGTVSRTVRFAPRGMRRKAAVALAAALVLLLLSAKALAATGFFGTIGWDRKPVPTQEQPAPTPVPPGLAPGSRLDAAVSEYLATAPGDEIWSAACSDGAAGTSLWESVDSLDGLRTLLENADTSIALPERMPDGYALVEGRAWFHYPAGGTLRLIGTEEKYGITIERYAVDGDYRRCVSGYTLTFQNNAGNLLRVAADVRQSAENDEFGVMETNAYTAVTVDGMDDGLLFLREGDMVLFCRRMIPYTEYPELLFALWAAQREAPSSAEENTGAFDSVVYRISSETLDEQALLQIANGLR